MSLIGKIVITLSLFAIMIGSVSCTDKSTQNMFNLYEPTDTFPLTSGSWWHYEGFIELANPSDSIYSDTFDLEIHRAVLGPATGYPDGLIARDDTIIINFGYALDTTICRKLINIEDDKLKIFASGCAPAGHPLYTNELDIPITLLDFPLDDEKTWSNDIGYGHHENFSVVGAEYMDVGTGWSVCDVLYSDVVDDSAGEIHSSTYKWYNDDGLMRFQSMNRTDFGGDPPGGTQLFKEFRVVDKHIH